LPSLGALAYRPADGGPDVIVPFGMPGSGNSIPMPGDYDGSGKTELAVYMPSLGEFAYRPADGGADVIVPFGIAGSGQTLPAPGDYTGVGHDELAAYLPSQGVFAIRPDTGPDLIEAFGIPDQSIPITTVPIPQAIPTVTTIFPLTDNDSSTTVETTTHKKKTGDSSKS
jgi:hypothetical protein